MTDPTQEFRQTLQAAGLTPPDMLIPGKLHRCPSNDRHSDKAGWCKLFDDGMGGVYGDHRNSTSETWQFRQADRMSEADREAFRQQVEQARRERDAEQARIHREAAKKAVELWNKANPHPDPNHAYLVRKGGLPPLGIRQMNDALVIPLYGADKALTGLQFIQLDGQKRFITGTRKAGSWCVLKPEGIPPTDWSIILVAEGWATAASLHTATGLPVFIAFDCGNLSAVAQYIRRQFPTARLLFCADDDAHGKGQHHARLAAQLTNGIAIIPTWEESEHEH